MICTLSTPAKAKGNLKCRPGSSCTASIWPKRVTIACSRSLTTKNELSSSSSTMNAATAMAITRFETCMDRSP